MTTSTRADYLVDYLVVGAGITGLGFADELLTRTSDSILIVDKRHRPGGHWVDDYPFVRLHGPANVYGVESKELAPDGVDSHGFNKGLPCLASGAEIQAYCVSLIRDTFLKSGRVTYLPLTEYLFSDGTLRQPLTGKTSTVQIRKKLVDATYYDNTIPLYHTPSFAIELTCIPPNYLPNTARNFSNFTIIGAGKTGMDSCLWLLENGVDPTRIRWIIANDYWIFNRDNFPTDVNTLAKALQWRIAMYESIIERDSPLELMLRLEKAGALMRLDTSIEPKQFRGAILSRREFEELRRLKNIVRKGYVTKIEPKQISCKQGVVSAEPDTLYVDCSATALPTKPIVPVFQPGKIVPQIIRWPTISFSAPKIAFLESLDMSDEERNYYSTPIQYGKTNEIFLQMLPTDLENIVREQSHPDIKKWLATCRSERYTRMANDVRPDDTKTIAVLERMKDTSQRAYKAMQKPRASL